MTKKQITSNEYFFNLNFADDLYEIDDGSQKL
jgi:hypothetical protein